MIDLRTRAYAILLWSIVSIAILVALVLILYLPQAIRGNELCLRNQYVSSISSFTVDGFKIYCTRRVRGTDEVTPLNELK